MIFDDDVMRWQDEDEDKTLDGCKNENFLSCLIYNENLVVCLWLLFTSVIRDENNEHKTQGKIKWTKMLTKKIRERGNESKFSVNVNMIA